MIDIAPAAIVKVLAAIVLVWLWLHLWELLMVIVVAVVLAIALDPVVDWLERHRVPRGLGSALCVLTLTVLVVGFFWIAGASLGHQARLLGERVSEVRDTALGRLPGWMADAIRARHWQASDTSSMAGYVMTAGGLIVTGAIVAVLALIITVYLLIDGRQTYIWLAAYAPPSRRARVHVTAVEARKAIFAYAIGNIITSVFAAIFALVVLSALDVPAALLLAVMAGVCDFIPVLGFILSSVPAILLALTVSPAVALTVAALYIGYHLAENYYIGPKVYGDRLRLSNLAVIVAFAVGAEVGGIVGALVALPFAALYPVIENIWLKEYLGRDTAETHRRIENEA